MQTNYMQIEQVITVRVWRSNEASNRVMDKAVM